MNSRPPRVTRCWAKMAGPGESRRISTARTSMTGQVTNRMTSAPRMSSSRLSDRVRPAPVGQVERPGPQQASVQVAVQRLGVVPGIVLDDRGDRGRRSLPPRERRSPLRPAGHRWPGSGRPADGGATAGRSGWTSVRCPGTGGPGRSTAATGRRLPRRHRRAARRARRLRGSRSARERRRPAGAKGGVGRGGGGRCRPGQTRTAGRSSDLPGGNSKNELVNPPGHADDTVAMPSRPDTRPRSSDHRGLNRFVTFISHRSGDHER